MLTPKEYLSCLIRAQTNKETVRKTRYAFIYKTHHYTLTKYERKVEWVLRVLTRDQEAAIEVPQFVRMIRLLQRTLYTVTEKFSLALLHDEEPPVTTEEPSTSVAAEAKSDSEDTVSALPEEPKTDAAPVQGTKLGDGQEPMPELEAAPEQD